jgi:hypothetical protein
MSKPAAVRHKRRDKMSQSAAVMAAVQARSLVAPTMVRGVILAARVTVIDPKDFGRLGVDERYQRLRITNQINMLVKVLRGGGQVADPIDVAERPDGSWWIVDGQQRFWAHDECQAPLRANIHKVKDLASETALFLALNARRKVSARVTIKGWQGPTGDFVRWCNESDQSPIRGLVDFGNNSKLPIDATTLVKGALAVNTGLLANGDMGTRVLPRADVALAVTGARAWAEEYVRLLAAVFDTNTNAGKVRILPALALARVAHRKYSAAGRPVFPKTCSLLRRCNWDTIVPTHASRFLPMLEGEVEKRWKE